MAGRITGDVRIRESKLFGDLTRSLQDLVGIGERTTDPSRRFTIRSRTQAVSIRSQPLGGLLDRFLGTGYPIREEDHPIVLDRLPDDVTGPTKVTERLSEIDDRNIRSGTVDQWIIRRTG